MTTVRLFCCSSNKLLPVGKRRVCPPCALRKKEICVLLRKRTDSFALNRHPLKTAYPLGMVLRYPVMNCSFPSTLDLLPILEVSDDCLTLSLGYLGRELKLFRRQRRATEKWEGNIPKTCVSRTGSNQILFHPGTGGELSKFSAATTASVFGGYVLWFAHPFP